MITSLQGQMISFLSAKHGYERSLYFARRGLPNELSQPLAPFIDSELCHRAVARLFTAAVGMLDGA